MREQDDVCSIGSICARKACTSIDTCGRCFIGVAANTSETRARCCHLGAGWRPSTRWTTTLSSKVKLPHAINFRALCGANVVTCQVVRRVRELGGDRPHGGLRPFHQKSTCLTQLTLVPYVVRMWSRARLCGACGSWAASPSAPP